MSLEHLTYEQRLEMLDELQAWKADQIEKAKNKDPKFSDADIKAYLENRESEAKGETALGGKKF